MQTFLEFINKKQRDVKDRLRVLKSIFDNADYKTKDYVDDVDNPYVYVYSNKKTPFEGVRVYGIGDSYAYRTQNQEDTQPYGIAMNLDIDGMFQDYIQDDISDKKIAEAISDSIVGEIASFFEKNEKYAGVLPNRCNRDNIAVAPVSVIDFGTSVIDSSYSGR